MICLANDPGCFPIRGHLRLKAELLTESEILRRTEFLLEQGNRSAFLSA